MHAAVKKALGVKSANCLSCFNFDNGRCSRHGRQQNSNLLYFPFVSDQKCWFPEVPAAYLEKAEGFNNFLLIVKVYDNGTLLWPYGVTPKLPKKLKCTSTQEVKRRGAEAAFTRFDKEGDEPEAIPCKKCGTVSRYTECPFCHTKRKIK